MDFFQSQILLKGQLVITKGRNRQDTYLMDVKLVASHSVNGRVIGEIVRTYETEAGSFHHSVQQRLDSVTEKISEDLAVQLFDAWKSGTFGATLIRLGVRGNLNYQELTQFRRLLGEKVKDIRNLKDRVYEPGQVVFEVDASGTSRQLADIVARTKFPRFKVDVVDVRPEGLDLRVVAQ